MWLVLYIFGVFLIKIRANRAILPRSSSDSFDGVQELGRRLEVWLEGAIRCSCCYSGGRLFGSEGEFGPAINRDDAAWTGHR